MKFVTSNNENVRCHVDNMVHKKHMLFNNLPVGAQKPAEIKLQAAKNTPLKSLWSTTKIGKRAAEL